MTVAVYAAIALAGATIHLWRDGQPRSRRRTLEIYLVWWLAVAIGAMAIVSGLNHLFDGKVAAEDLGLTRGDAGFQNQVGFADLAVGTVAIFSIRFRGDWWLAALIAAAISFWGDAYAHIHQAQEFTFQNKDTVAPIIAVDIAYPLFGLLLYGLWRYSGKGSPATPA